MNEKVYELIITNILTEKTFQIIGSYVKAETKNAESSHSV